MSMDHDLSRQQPDMSGYTITADEASLLFRDAGVARSPRTVIRYCMQKHLDCIKVDTDRNEKYLIAHDSVQARIQELQQMVTTSHVASQPDISRHDETQRDTARHDQTDQEERKKLEAEIEVLKRENFDLKITNRVKDQFLEQTREERNNLLQQAMDYSRRIGELETKLLQLAPPRHEAPRSIVHDAGAPDYEGN